MYDLDLLLESISEDLGGGSDSYFIESKGDSFFKRIIDKIKKLIAIIKQKISNLLSKNNNDDKIKNAIKKDPSLTSKKIKVVNNDAFFNAAKDELSQIKKGKIKLSEKYKKHKAAALGTGAVIVMSFGSFLTYYRARCKKLNKMADECDKEMEQYLREAQKEIEKVFSGMTSDLDHTVEVPVVNLDTPEIKERERKILSNSKEVKNNDNYLDTFDEHMREISQMYTTVMTDIMKASDREIEIMDKSFKAFANEKLFNNSESKDDDSFNRNDRISKYNDPSDITILCNDLVDRDAYDGNMRQEEIINSITNDLVKSKVRKSIERRLELYLKTPHASGEKIAYATAALKIIREKGWK